MSLCFVYRGSSVNFLFCFVFYLFETGSHVSQANFELTTNVDKVDLSFLPVTPESWNYKLAPPYPVYEVLGITPRGLCMLGNLSTEPHPSSVFSCFNCSL